MRLPVLIAAFAIAIPIGLGASEASAQFFQDQSIIFGRLHVYQGAWCGHEDLGGGFVREDCSFDSFEHCRWAVMGANNAFCTQNPGYAGPPPRVAHKKKKRSAHR